MRSACCDRFTSRGVCEDCPARDVRREADGVVVYPFHSPIEARPMTRDELQERYDELRRQGRAIG